MQAGAVYGCAAMLDGLIDRLEDELGEPATAVITGGFAPLIAPYCRRQVVVDENLLLNGLYIIYKKISRAGEQPDRIPLVFFAPM